MRSVSFTVNGRAVSGEAEPRTHLADFLREQRDLTGTHLGCEHGVCGACTILVDGAPVRSCITYAVACSGAEVTTIEGLDDDGVTAELREAFKREHALQCGYCTPGMLISARDLVLRATDANERAIRVAMSGNLCRCTGYVGIIRAIKSVIADRRARGVSPVAGGGRQKLGPVGADYAGNEISSRVAAAGPVAPARAQQEARVAIDPDWKPQASFDQEFVVAYPRDQVWEMFGRIREIASCMPGVTLLGKPTADHAAGQIRIKIGPISTEFRGEANIERYARSFSGRIVGAGSDARSSSATRGMIRYQLLPADEGRATAVKVTVGYTLTGMLAQFGRSGIVHDVAGRLTRDFVRNLEARLGGKAGTEPTASAGVDAGSLVLSLLAEKIKAIFRRLFSSRWRR
ncbi:MAG TPA: 2Fe-2S iron-sulfur cluster-binding protein [Xanthobacteraceae bacterium]|nr:2Fe-2S iron-sulfur cluster-binding protein [Xanthobacteraceae bacterium]